MVYKFKTYLYKNKFEFLSQIQCYFYSKCILAVAGNGNMFCQCSSATFNPCQLNPPVAPIAAVAIAVAPAPAASLIAVELQFAPKEQNISVKSL